MSPYEAFLHALAEVSIVLRVVVQEALVAVKSTTSKPSSLHACVLD